MSTYDDVHREALHDARSYDYGPNTDGYDASGERYAEEREREEDERLARSGPHFAQGATEHRPVLRQPPLRERGWVDYDKGGKDWDER